MGISKFYDQIGGNACGGASCDVVQATVNNQPLLMPTGGGVGGTLPYIAGLGDTGIKLQSANNFTPSTSFSSAVIGYRLSGSPSSFFQTRNLVSANNIEASTAGHWASVAGTTITGVAADAAWHAGVAVIDVSGGTSVLNIDGTETSGASTGTDTTAGLLTMMLPGSSTTQTQMLGAFFEDGTVWSSGTRTALCHNMITYAGISGSC
jgi:hypothetical protein